MESVSYCKAFCNDTEDMIIITIYIEGMLMYSVIQETSEKC